MKKLEELVGGKGKATAVKVLIAVVLGVVLYLLPIAALTHEAKLYLGVFAAFIFMVSTSTISLHGGVLMALVAFIITGTCDLATAFAPYGTETVWAVFGVIGLATAISNTGLFKRLALLTVRLFPNTYRGQTLAITLASAICCPMIPSTVGKNALLGSVTVSLFNQSSYERNSKPTAGLFSCFFIPSSMFSNVFMSGTPMVAVMIGMIRDPSFTYASWFVACCIFGLVVILGAWLGASLIYGPKKGEIGSEATGGENPAVAQLRAMGAMSKNEKIALVVLLVCVVLWVTQGLHGLSTATVSIAALVILNFFNLFTPADYIKCIPWPIIIITGGILTISNLMSSTGLGTWVSSLIAPILGSLASNPFLLVILVVVVTFLLRYVIVSQMATVIIISAVFSAVAVANGISAFLVIFTAYLTTCATYQLPFNNTNFISVDAITNKMVDHKHVKSTSYFAVLLTLVGCLASVPLWMALGLC